ncbi:hypothetical protein B0H19DRAFT_1057515 [Mycena capillaripes]|nr:hypothetical protein B0H19DRAFT_1057515 [Mycena capillaripes]
MNSTNANLGITVEEASVWVCPAPHHLEAQYPALALHDERVQTWLGDNQESIEKAVEVFLVHDPCFKDVPSVSRIPSGSLFAKNRNMGYVQTYWNPPTIQCNHKGITYTIQCDHKGITYTVSTPEHVAVLHTIRDWPTALAYLQAHYDSRRAMKPLVFTVPDSWCADVVVGWPKNGSENKEFHCQPDWIACQHYFSEHYNLKEVVDPEGRVVSSELDRVVIQIPFRSHWNSLRRSSPCHNRLVPFGVATHRNNTFPELDMTAAVLLPNFDYFGTLELWEESRVIRTRVLF